MKYYKNWAVLLSVLLAALIALDYISDPVRYRFSMLSLLGFVSIWWLAVRRRKRPIQ